MFQNSITTRAARDTNKRFSRHLHLALHSTSLFSLIVLFCPTLESSVPTFFAYGWLFSPYLHLLCTLLLTPWERMVVFSFIWWVDGVCWRKPTIVVVWTELLARDMISWSERCPSRFNFSLRSTSSNHNFSWHLFYSAMGSYQSLCLYQASAPKREDGEPLV